MPRVRWTLVPAALLVAAAFAQPAAAAELCVHHAGSDCLAGSSDKGSDLQGALDDAALTSAADVIRIGPGVYAGEFTYAGPSPLHILGSGRGETNLHGNAAGVHVLATGGADVSRLSVRLPTKSFFVGIRAEEGSAITDVQVEANPAPASGRTGIHLLPG